MKNSFKTSSIMLLIVAITGCQKNYTCECKNPGGVSATYKLKETKTKAKSICDKHNDEVNSLPWSETYCELK